MSQAGARHCAKEHQDYGADTPRKDALAATAAAAGQSAPFKTGLYRNIEIPTFKLYEIAKYRTGRLCVAAHGSVG